MHGCIAIYIVGLVSLVPSAIFFVLHKAKNTVLRMRLGFCLCTSFVNL